MNTLQDLMDTVIMPLALPVLREACVMPALVNTDFSAQAAQKNEVIRVPLPQDLGAADEVNVSTGTTSTALDDPKVDIKLDKWIYKQFAMTDKEMRESVTSAILPSAADAAVKSLANAVDKALLGLYVDIPYFAGTPGTVLGTSEGIVNARAVLQRNLCPMTDRRLVVDINSEAKLIVLYSDVAKTGSTAALLDASLGRKFGFETYADQLMPYHTFGGITARAAVTVDGNVLAGATTMNIADATTTDSIKKGDTFTVDGVVYDDGTPKMFTVTEDAACTSGSLTGLKFWPPAPTGGFTNDKVIDWTGPASGTTSAVNLAFNRNAFCFAARPLSDEPSESSTISVASDPITGIPLRLETWRDPGKATRQWRFDILYGVKTLRPELACRVWGVAAA